MELENDYRSVLAELEKDDELSKYATEFTRLFKALYVSHLNEDRLLTETQELQDKLSRNGSQLSIAVKLQMSDQETINILKKVRAGPTFIIQKACSQMHFKSFT